MKATIFFIFASLSLTTSFAPFQRPRSLTTLSISTGYVPDGMTPEQYRQLKAKEQQKNSSKKYGAYGPQTFKSRSLQSFQKDLEKGKQGHLMPMFNAKEKLKSGKIRQEDIPYMQRGGSWDNSDIKSAKKKKWSADDKKYNQNPTRVTPDWMGTVQRRGPSQNTKKNVASSQTPKKKFGLW